MVGSIRAGLLMLTPLVLLLHPTSVIAQVPDKPLVVATATMLADIAEQIGGDLVEVQSIVPVGGDPHLHEPTADDAVLLNQADLILRNGLTFEGWLTRLIDNSGAQAPVVTVTEGVEVLQSLDYENATDPHAWMNALNGIVYARNTRDALVALLPEYREVLIERYTAYVEELRKTDTYIEMRIAEIPEHRRVLITSHDAFQYFGKRYGLRLEAAMGVSTDADVQTRDIIRLQNLILKDSIPAIFVEQTINPKLLRQVSEDTGARIGGSLYADSLGEPGSEAGTYLGMLRYNARTIADALSRTDTERALADAHDHTGQGSSNLLLIGMIAVLLIGGFVYTVVHVKQG